MNIQLNVMYEYLCIMSLDVSLFLLSVEGGRNQDMSSLFILQKLFETKRCLSWQLPFIDIHMAKTIVKKTPERFAAAECYNGLTRSGENEKGEDSWIF